VVAEQARSRGVKATIILEPERRDSVAAIAAVSEFATKHDAEEVLLVAAADHLIPDVEAFVAACRTALPARRLSSPLPPGSPMFPGNSGAIRSHWASLNTVRIKADLHFSALNQSFRSA
jgi:Nucleotidyl transferase